GAAALGKLLDASLEKGDAFCVARIAGIQGAKGASALIPLCHSLILEQVSVDLEPFPSEGRVRVLCEARATGPTGVEMEALCGAGMAALTLYDMCKGMNRGIRIDGLRLLEKEGGRSGLYRAEDARAEDAGSAPEQQ
ncbi:MAG: cyclic pyranopterin monophosphate synthase MoaC, partial [Planctomycetota bacterium]